MDILKFWFFCLFVLILNEKIEDNVQEYKVNIYYIYSDLTLILDFVGERVLYLNLNRNSQVTIFLQGS